MLDPLSYFLDQTWTHSSRAWHLHMDLYLRTHSAVEDEKRKTCPYAYAPLTPWPKKHLETRSKLLFGSSRIDSMATLVENQL